MASVSLKYELMILVSLICRGLICQTVCLITRICVCLYEVCTYVTDALTLKSKPTVLLSSFALFTQSDKFCFYGDLILKWFNKLCRSSFLTVVHQAILQSASSDAQSKWCRKHFKIGNYSILTLPIKQQLPLKAFGMCAAITCQISHSILPNSTAAETVINGAHWLFLNDYCPLTLLHTTVCVISWILTLSTAALFTASIFSSWNITL